MKMTPRIGYATCAQYRELAASDRLSANLLRELGFEVVPVVWTEVRPWEVGCDVVVIRSVWDYHLHVDRFLAWVADTATNAVVLNAPETIRWNSDKRYLFDLERAGLPVPRMVLLEQGSRVDVRLTLLDLSFNTAVIKPVVSASAYETYRLNLKNAEMVQSRVDQLLQLRALLVQEYVPEITSEGEWSLMFFGREYSHAVRKLPQAGDFRVQAEHGGRHEAGFPPESVLAVAKAAADRFASGTLYARIDIVEQKRTPLIMEVELIDPELFLAENLEAPKRFAAALERFCRNIESNRRKSDWNPG